ncbi:HNH endonuclease [Cocleimonas flava]|uniref:HNH nuclease domain-containing protein n=1 Tax=Cocleimonas flava TaxID=634765 RepID=A0A4R1F4T4_9GAMM|nr:HNH endonuclease [Cocleimonas flava]TCJ89267.1 hypothetical protein EV695_1129 [Cocleimonas flava]
MYRVRLQEKLRTYSQVDPVTNCWEWLGQVSNSGHGRITVRDNPQSINKKLTAETASYTAFIGDIPDGMFVGQSCGNRLCINPDHLCIKKIPTR